jgi:hypothetical protein
MDECGIHASIFEEEVSRPRAAELPTSGPERPPRAPALRSPVQAVLARDGAQARAGVLPHSGPRHPRYASFASRLETFSDSWPPALRQRPEDMAEAGLVYLGLSDQVKCFYCGGGLREWGQEDVPWVEHAGWLTVVYFTASGTCSRSSKKLAAAAVCCRNQVEF